MKKIIILFVSILMLSSCEHVFTYFSEVENKTYYLDFPEEIELISEDKNNPDSIVCYVSNDSLIFRFVVSERRKHEYSK